MLLDRALFVAALILWFLAGVFVIRTLAVTFRRQGLGPAFRALLVAPTVALVVTALAITLISESAVFIHPENVGVVVSLVSRDGVRDRPLRGGLRWIVPLLEDVVVYPSYWQTYTMTGNMPEEVSAGLAAITARTSDGQSITIDSSIVFRIDPEQVVRVHLDWQNRYAVDFLRPVGRGVVQTLVSQYTVDEVNSAKRSDLEAEIDRQMRVLLLEKGFLLDRFILRDIAFSPEYSASVEAKQVALQQALGSQYQARAIREIAGAQADAARKKAAGQADAVRLAAEAEAAAIIMRATAEGQAIQIVREAVAHDTEYLTFRYIEKLSPNIRVMLVPNNTPLILPLPELGGLAEEAAPTAEPTAAPTTAAPTPAPTVTP